MVTRRQRYAKSGLHFFRRILFYVIPLLVFAAITVIAVIFYFSRYGYHPNAGLPDGLYTMQQRIGVAISCQPGTLDPTSVNQPVWYRDIMNATGVGWYYNWDYNWNCSQANADPAAIEGFAYLPIVGGGNATYSAQLCDSLQNNIRTYIRWYPSRTIFAIGNELGTDYTHSPETYANDYANWSQCLKQIDPSYRIGIGAVRNLRYYIDARKWGEKTSITGADYVKRVAAAYNANHMLPLVPDAFVTHGFTEGYVQNAKQVSASVDAFKSVVLDYRSLMNELGWRTTELVINEFTPASLINGNTDSLIQFMNGANDYLATAVDGSLGNPYDAGHLVQKWAWYLTAKGGNTKTSPSAATGTTALALVVADPSRPLTPKLSVLGRAFKEESCSLQDPNRYPSTPVCTFGPQLLANPHFNTNASGWTGSNNGNVAVGWDKRGLRISSSGNGSGGWCQYVTGVAGKRLFLSGRVTTDTPMAVPYFAINTYSNTGITYSYQGTPSVQPNSCGEISKEVTVGGDVDKIAVCFDVVNAPASNSWAKWMSLCEAP